MYILLVDHHQYSLRIFAPRPSPPIFTSLCETLVKLLCVYNSAKDELLLKYFRRKYLCHLEGTFNISKQLVSTLKQYSDKKLSLIKTTLKQVCF